MKVITIDGYRLVLHGVDEQTALARVNGIRKTGLYDTDIVPEDDSTGGSPHYCVFARQKENRKLNPADVFSVQTQLAYPSGKKVTVTTVVDCNAKGGIKTSILGDMQTSMLEYQDAGLPLNVHFTYVQKFRDAGCVDVGFYAYRRPEIIDHENYLPARKKYQSRVEAQQMHRYRPETFQAA